MKLIRIGEYFESFATKTLVDVDINALKSNQHEFNGSKQFREMLGTPLGKTYLPTRMAYLTDDQDEMPELFEASLTWYDTRENDPSRSPEYRLLYPAAAEPVIFGAKAGDTLFLAREQGGDLLLVIAEQGSTILRQLQWIFDVRDTARMLFVSTSLEDNPERDEIASDELLGLLGIEVDLGDQHLDLLLHQFPMTAWPTTTVFAKFARSLVNHVDPIADPDGALLAWVTMEHRLFRMLERHRISEAIGEGFISAGGAVDVEAFLKLSLSVINRRKARAGLSLEEHLETLLQANSIEFAKKAKTEGKKEPDFLFPSKNAYDDLSFPADKLAMLGSKTTLKDRWRQVLNEADRIPKKHLLTLQPAISEDQTNEMKAENLQLVIPKDLHVAGFSVAQQDWLLGLDDLIDELRSRAAHFHHWN